MNRSENDDMGKKLKVIALLVRDASGIKIVTKCDVTVPYKSREGEKVALALHSPGTSH